MNGNVESLPKWARQEIERLRANVEHWKAKATAGPEDSTVFIMNYGFDATPLGHDIEIRFVMPGDEGELTVRQEDSHLRVTSRTNDLTVRPVVSNVIEVYP